MHFFLTILNIIKKKKHKLLKYTLFNSNKVLKSVKLSKIIDKNK